MHHARHSRAKPINAQASGTDHPAVRGPVRRSADRSSGPGPVGQVPHRRISATPDFLVQEMKFVILVPKLTLLPHPRLPGPRTAGPTVVAANWPPPDWSADHWTDRQTAWTGPRTVATSGPRHQSVARTKRDTCVLLSLCNAKPQSRQTVTLHMNTKRGTAAIIGGATPPSFPRHNRAPVCASNSSLYAEGTDRQTNKRCTWYVLVQG